MAEFTSHAPGTFNWIDLATTDPAAAQKFYGTLFGWGAEKGAQDSSMTYWLFKKNGQDVGGLGELMKDLKERGVPPHWMSYVSVENAADTVKKAASLGGTVMVPDFDVMEHGRMAVLMDPGGAVFAVWQPKQHCGVQYRDEPDTLCWNEVGTHDPDKVGAFYTRLFGWETKTMAMGDGPPYTMFQVGGKSVGGMWVIPPEMKDVPPHWMVYFAVDDCDRKLATATGLGAKTIVPATDIPTIGRFATMHDPQGAVFSIIAMAG